jgi:anti-sigma B factor antagonist
MMEAMSEPDALEISIDFSGRDPVIVLTGYVDHTTTPQLRDALAEVIERNHDRLTLDVEGVTFMDSSGIGALATAYKRGAHVTVRHPSPTVMRELVMCGLDRLIAIN